MDNQMIPSNLDDMLKNIPLETLTNVVAIRTANQLQIQMKKFEEAQTQTNLALAHLDQKTDLITEQLKNVTHANKLAYSEDYVNPTNLGKNYRLLLSAQRVNKLLKYAGIYQQYTTEPYRNYYEGKNPLCVRQKWMANGREGYSYHFHEVRTWQHIYRQLTKDGHYHKFMGCKTTNDLDKFIDSLVIK